MRFLKFVFFASVVFFLFSIFFHSIIELDQDLGRHLLMGKIISQTLQVPKINLLSYTFPNFEFINSHWLSEVIFFQIDQTLGGLTSLLYFKVSVLIAAFGLTVYTAYRHSKSLVAAAVSFAIFAPVLLERTEIRPEMFSYLFVAVFLWILMSCDQTGKKNYDKIVWILPVLQLFWVNLHIYFILGPILMGIFLIQKIWHEYRASKNIEKGLLNAKYEILNMFLVCVATLVNPNFLAGALYPFNVFNNYGYSIVENQNVFFLKNLVLNPNINFFFIALAALVLSFVVTDWKKIKLSSLLITGLVVLPLMAIRSFPLLFLLQLPIMAWNLSNLNPNIAKRLSSSAHHLNLSKIAMALIIFVSGLTLLRAFRLVSNDYYLSIDSQKRFGNEVQESGKGTLDFVMKNHLHGPTFNNFDVGSYIAYRLYPKEKVFVDGRPEAFPAKFFQGVYEPMQMSTENFKTIDDIYKFNLIIFSHTDATPWAQTFLSTIINNSDFSLVYLDSYGTVFVKKSVYPKVAEKFEIKKNLANWRGLSSLSYISLAQVFSVFGWNDLAIQSAQKAYGLNSNSPGVLSAMGAIYSNDSASSILGQSYVRQFHQKTDWVIF